MVRGFAYAICNKSEGGGWYLIGGILYLVVSLLLMFNYFMTIVISLLMSDFGLLFRGLMAIGISIQLKIMSVLN
ncbi:hypothetical protein GCM10008107_07170 [Psychrosphaera saromensis]|uniref:Uncharacterized protein n=1 Tax=Psychrosphaera saromensis TaxID=716813 RepID=A0A2S7UXF1_9GAMM|nr:hypothetical protein BTO11_12385 [Psychrosphaera saromensis]GHB60489.1 hypothetical protein GCM10008107_07170 [Psychrosphaera saromensis]GLQ14585.1 hypothetical protein GCM10007917_20400 [Psychrosphaera saromensis]